MYSPIIIKNPPAICIYGISRPTIENFSSVIEFEIRFSSSALSRRKLIPFANKIMPRIIRKTSSINLLDCFAPVLFFY